MAGALDDIRVVEIASWVAGPSAAALLADMGADVVKVEPLGGDAMRNKLRQPAGAAAADYPFRLDNRGKRSIGCDMQTALVDRQQPGARDGADERYATPLDRFNRNTEVIGALDEHFASAGLDHWAPLLDRSGIVWSPVAELGIDDETTKDLTERGVVG